MAERLANPIGQDQLATTVVVLHNPKSKHADIGNTRIEALKQLFPGEGQVDVLESHPDLETTRQNVHESLIAHAAAGRQPVFAVAGGDGTVNMALQTLASSSTPEVIRDTPIVPLGTGNANDLAYMLYDDPSDVRRIFTQGRLVKVRPLQFLAIPPGKDPSDPAVLRIAERHIASNYISFGASAHGAHELNKKSVRKQARGETEDAGPKWYHDLKHKAYGQHVPDFLAFRAAIQAPPFTIEHEGKQLEIREILFGNGDRAAKVGKMPVQLHQPELYTATIRNQRFGRTALLLGAIQMIFGKMPGQILKNPTYTFRVLEDVPVQYDGETSVVRAGSTIIVSHAELAFHALTTRLAPAADTAA